MSKFIICLVTIGALTFLYSGNPSERLEDFQNHADEKFTSTVNFLKEGINTNYNTVHIVSSLVAMVGTLLWVSYKLYGSVERASNLSNLVVVDTVKHTPVEEESDTIKKAKSRALKSQLISDKLILESRQQTVIDELGQAEVALERAHKSLVEAQEELKRKEQVYSERHARTYKLRKQFQSNDSELAALALEIEKLKGLV